MGEQAGSRFATLGKREILGGFNVIQNYEASVCSQARSELSYSILVLACEGVLRVPMEKVICISKSDY